MNDEKRITEEKKAETMRFANHLGHTDVNPFEIVRRVSAKTLDIKPMTAVKDPNFKPEFVPGGFAAVCTNQYRQEWLITSNEDAPVKRIRLHKDGWFKGAHGERYRIAEHPVKFYDYNF